jgi:dUTP pyrophosphatase
LRTVRDADGLVADISLDRSDVSITIRKGDKIAQMSPFEARTQLEVAVVEDLSASNRGGKGFGSSGR